MTSVIETLSASLAIFWQISAAKLAETLHALSSPAWDNYIYWLLAVSGFFWSWEIFRPWRRKQGVFRKDFGLDAFYMIFNLFIFPLLGFAGISVLAESLLLHLFGAAAGRGMAREDLVVLSVTHWPVWVQIVVLFVARDFVQWCVHRLLHRVPWLWEFHKVHHSVEQMGFAAHLRYHWMENIIYRTLEYLPLALLGFGPVNFFLVYLISLVIGHWNHSNIRLPLGPLKYILNSPQMHIWHHAHELPEGHRYGVNYGLSLSVWDYLFGTAAIPGDGRDVHLGFPGVNDGFPKTAGAQLVYPFYSFSDAFSGRDGTPASTNTRSNS